MQTRSGKTYTTSATSCFMENNKPRVETNVDNGWPSIHGVFIQPRTISNELAKFLGKPPGSKMHRMDVARDFHRYINTNNLRNRENRLIINADEKLRKLLKLGRHDILTYFNLYGYLRPHVA